MSLATSFRLTIGEADKWRQQIVRFGDATDLAEALRRYPGALGDNDIALSNDLSVRLEACTRQIALENEDFSRSFLLRVIENRWAVDGLRREIISASPSLVRPTTSFEEPVKTIVEALQALRARVPARPSNTDFGDIRAFSALCLNIAPIRLLESALGELEATKALRDQLHFIQFEGREWLDLQHPGETSAGPAAPLIGLVLTAARAIGATLFDLPMSLQSLAQGCVDACRAAGQRLQSGDADEVAFAIATLRSLLVRDLPQVTVSLFELSRDLPLREFRALFTGMDQAIVAVVELGDTLRRRLMAQTLWQSADASIYSIEQAISNPTPRLLSDLTDHVLILRHFLRALLALTPQQRTFAAALQEALLSYDGQLADDAEIEALADVPAAWLQAIEELRNGVREKALEESQKLSRDLGQLLALRAPLQAVLQQIPDTCKLMLP